MALYLLNALKRGYGNASVVPSIQQCSCASQFDLVNMLETALFHLLLNIGGHLKRDERIKPIYFGTKRSKPQWTSMENDREKTIPCKLYFNKTWHTCCP